MHFVTMDPELAMSLIDGYENELEGELRKLEAFYRQFTCPKCRSSMAKELNSLHTFSDPETLVPRSLLRCTSCDLLLDPHTGLILQR